jgi:hypothetical protein
MELIKRILHIFSTRSVMQAVKRIIEIVRSDKSVLKMNLS